MTPQEFSQKVKQKYPQYKDIDDMELTQKIITKYPQYAESVNFTVSKEPQSFIEKAEDVGSKVTDFIGGSKVAETFGAEIAKRQVPEEQRQFIEQPTLKETTGSALSLGSLFVPIGKLATGIAKGAKSLGATNKLAQYIGNITAGGTTGAGFDIGNKLSEDEQAELGLSTILGAGIPAASPIARALGKSAVNLVGRGASEVQGALTGTSAETIEQAFNAARTGGKDLEQFTNALRGQTTPEKLVNTVRQNIGSIASQRQTLYRNTLDELSDITVKTGKAKDNFLAKLQETGISVGDNALLDFSKSKLKLVPQAQTKIQTAYQEVANLGDNITLGELDTTRQALKALSQAGDDPSANLANKLIDDAVRSVRETGEQVTGYGQMLDNFGETSQFLDELEKGLSSGNKRTVDQAYRRMATALKTNNEQRKALIQELDAVTDGAVLSTIAGQQLSEALPRGIFRQIAAGLAGVGIVSGGITAQAIPALIFASPRVTGEFIRALGLSANKTEAIVRAIGDAREVILKAGIIGGGFDDTSNLEQ